MMRRLIQRSLFRRVYFHSLMIVLVVTVAVGGLFYYLGPQLNVLAIITELSRTLLQQNDFSEADNAELNRLLRDLHQTTDMSFALVDRDNSIYANAGPHKLSPLNPDDVATLFKNNRATHFRPALLAFPLIDKPRQLKAYLLVRMNKSAYHWSLLLSLATVFALIAVVSIPLVRTMTSPLERLTQTTEMLASGNLAARTKIDSDDEIGVLAKNIDYMAMTLANRIQAEKELLANVSHELRTPLSRIKVALALCTEDDTVTINDLQRQLGGIESDVVDLERMIDDVMDVARYDLSEQSEHPINFKVSKTDTSLYRISMACKERFETLNPAWTLSISGNENIPPIGIDASLIKRVIDNLLDNAVKFSPVGSTIELEIGELPNGQFVKVRDSGFGIDKEDLEKIFEPFFRTDRSRNRGTGGTGLGLALCKRIVAAHHGSISASNLDGGTEFLVRLPIVRNV